MSEAAQLARRRGTWKVPVAWALSLLVALFIGWFAASGATQPPQAALPAPTPVVTEVVEGTVSEVQDAAIVAEWPTEPVGVNGVDGVLTSMELPTAGAEVAAGDVVYTVDLAPVVAAAGDVPAFRALQQGSTGGDVAQLQRMLIGLDFLEGDADGAFDANTAEAVERWNTSLGFEDDATVPLGRIVFVPDLPAPLAPSEEAVVGTRIGAGVFVLFGAASEPEMSFSVLPEMLDSVVEGTSVRIDAHGTTWDAVVSHLRIDESDQVGATYAVLAPVDGAESICGGECGDVVALGGRTVLPGVLVLVPEVSGAVVPTPAITTDAAAVTLPNGERIEVQVVASADGRSVVEGVDIGTEILVVPEG